jgi:hypothetical protein
MVRTAGGVRFDRVTSAQTDDLGEYRLFGLSPGEFAVATEGGPHGTVGGPIRIDRTLHNYYPRGDALEQAQSILINPGAEVPGIDLVVSDPSAGLQVAGAPLVPAARAVQSGTILGQVVNTEGVPARRKLVVLAAGDDGLPPSQTFTDDGGRYAFRNVRPGLYLLSSRGVGLGVGSNRVAFGQRSPAERGGLITVQAGAVLDIDLTLPPAAVISGRIVDEYGDPMENAHVRVERIEFKGRRRLSGAVGGMFGGPSRQTNDLGRYRVFGLPPGRYVVSAVVGETVPGWQTADWPGYARTYFPSTPVPDEGQTVEVGQGEDRLNVDITLLRGHVARIAGTAYTAAGEPLQGQVSLIQSYRSGAIATPPVSVRTNVGGSFEFLHLGPGEYVLHATGPRANVWTEGAFGARFVTVDGADATGIVMRLSSGSTIEGRLTLEGGDRPDDPDFRLSAVPADPDLAPLLDELPARADIREDLTFEITGLNGPRRLQLTHAPEGWMLKTVLVNGADATDMVLGFGTPAQSLREVEVVLTRRISDLIVVARSANGDVVTDFKVVVFATDRTRWYAASRFLAYEATLRDGTVRVSGLPPGEYYVATIDGRSRIGKAEALEDSAFLESLVADATKVTLAEGEHRAVSVRLLDR